MSGSSLDGLDIAYCTFEVETKSGFSIKNWEIILTETIPYTKAWQEKLVQLIHASALEFAATHVHYARYTGALVNSFLQKHSIAIDCIAAHGHTIFHFPEQYFTTQIGDGAALAEVTGYPVIYDFRTQDVAAGGQGAPIASIADKYLFSNYDFCLNIGGIVNITSHINDKYIAFDISGANQILNKLVAEIGLTFDDKGALASKGIVLQDMLEQSNQLDFLHQDYPKTLDNQWVKNKLIPVFQSNAALENRLRTACEHIAYQIAQSIFKIIEQEKLEKKSYQLLVAGGGAYNNFLIDCIRQQFEQKMDINIHIPSEAIIEFKEAAMIALMGVMRLHNVPNVMKSVTGATRDTINGAIYQSWKKHI